GAGLRQYGNPPPGRGQDTPGQYSAPKATVTCIAPPWQPPLGPIGCHAPGTAPGSHGSAPKQQVTAQRIAAASSAATSASRVTSSHVGGCGGSESSSVAAHRYTTISSTTAHSICMQREDWTIGSGKLVVG